MTSPNSGFSSIKQPGVNLQLRFFFNNQPASLWLLELDYLHCRTVLYCTLFYLLVITHGVIDQFCGLYFTAWPTKLQIVPFSVWPINLRDAINILLTSFSRYLLYITDPHFFPLIYGPNSSRLSHKSMAKDLVCSLQYGPQISLVRGAVYALHCTSLCCTAQHSSSVLHCSALCCTVFH